MKGGKYTMKIYINNPIFLDLQKIDNKIAHDEIFVQLCFNDKYFISNYGRLYSEYRGCLLVPQLTGRREKNEQRYTYLLSVKNDKPQRYFAHRLVAEVYVENSDPLNKTYVHHIDADPFNNDYRNLQWVSPAEHSLITNGKSIFLYDDEMNERTFFESYQHLCDHIGVDKGKVMNAIYQGKIDSRPERFTRIYKFQNNTNIEQPIYVGVINNANKNFAKFIINFLAAKKMSEGIEV